ncbi:hypothetical protein AAHC03_0846 [Spirometra sp. Aus1]
MLASILLGFLHLAAGLQTYICPRGYWAAKVRSSSPGQSIGDYSSDREFSLPYGPIGNAPICRFCPDVSCFIRKLKHEVTKDKPETRRRPRPHQTQAQTTTPIVPAIDDLFTVFDNTTSTKAPETHEEAGVQMSCTRYADLPFPEEIITYLDCVQIGQADQYYLFIYTPVNKENEVEPVDCIDPDFLRWVPENVSIKSIELGFPMKRLPPYFFRYYGRLLKSTQQVCFDSSAIQNNEIDYHDMQWLGGKTLVQVVFRHDGLQRNRIPPKQPETTAPTATNSTEEVAECPSFAFNEFAQTYPDKDCRYKTAVMPLSATTIAREDVIKNCTCQQCVYEKPVIKVTRSERNLLPVPRYVKTLLNMALLTLVLVLIFGTVLGFCVQNRDKAMLLFLTRSRKRRMEAALAAEAAEKAAKEAEENSQINWHQQLFNRYAMAGLAGGSGLAFGPFAGRIPLPTQNDQTAVTPTSRSR